MLSKLIKHELRATSRPILPLGAAMVAYALLYRLLTALHLTRQWPNLDQTLAGLGLTFFVLLMAACGLIGTFLLVSRYYHSLYTDEGYLMNTLPVTPGELICSKLLTAFLWSVFLTLSGIVAVLAAAAGTATFREVVGGLADAIAQGWQMLRFDPPLRAVIVSELVLLILLSPLAGFLRFYAAISLGQLMRGHRLLGAVACYFALNFAFSLVAALLMMVTGGLGVNLFSSVAPSAAVAVAWGYALGIVVVEGVVYFLISHWGLSKKLELE